MIKEMDRKKALRLLKKYGIEGRILKHSLAVNKFAVSLAKKLKNKGAKVNLYLVDMASLLHDIGKKKSNDTGRDHVDIGVEILEQERYPELVRIVAKHGKNSGREELIRIEEKIVCYSDARVEENKVVSLNKRFEGIFNRYPNDKKIMKKSKLNMKKIEKELMSKFK